MAFQRPLKNLSKTPWIPFEHASSQAGLIRPYKTSLSWGLPKAPLRPYKALKCLLRNLCCTPGTLGCRGWAVVDGLLKPRAAALMMKAGGCMPRMLVSSKLFLMPIFRWVWVINRAPLKGSIVAFPWHLWVLGTLGGSRRFWQGWVYSFITVVLENPVRSHHFPCNFDDSWKPLDSFWRSMTLLSVWVRLFLKKASQ